MSFSLRAMFIIVVYVGLVSAFLVTINTIWSQIAFLMTFAFVILAAISAVLGPVDTRAGRGCFAFAAGIYLILFLLSPSSNDYFLVGTLFAKSMFALDEFPRFHASIRSRVQQDPNFKYNLAVGIKTIGNCAFALLFGAFANWFGRRLQADHQARDESRPDGSRPS